MQSSSLLCSSNQLSSTPSLSISQRPTVRSRNRCIGPVATLSCAALATSNYFKYRRSLSRLHSTATEEIVETGKIESEFIEIGHISGVHGLQGEVRVKPSTDFPELRFSKSGRRWLRQQVLGREKIQEVELVEGRGHPGQKSWIVRFNEVDTVDQAQRLVGSTVLVREEDRPELEEGEFYTRDLVGMRVLLKETGKPVGTVVNVFDSGGSDLLHVMLDSSLEMSDGTGKPKLQIGPSGPLVWIPFAEAIVPNVDMIKREMLITPPKGLLELNVRTDERSKKERRQLEWKERKKFQQRLIAAKKKLCEMEQKHVFHGFRFGERSQTGLLSDQILSVNTKLLQQALQSTAIPSKRWNAAEFIKSYLSKEMRSAMQTSEQFLTTSSGEKLNSNSKLQEKGHLLTSEGKVAIALVVDDSKKLGSSSSSNVDFESTEDSPCMLLKRLLSDDQRFIEMEDRVSVPLILVCPSNAIASLQKLFLDHDHFAFDSEKVWFLEEEKLPVISSSLEEQNKQKILMKSPWEILQTPVGSGGVISLFSSHNILEKFNEMGVEYIEVCSVNQRFEYGHTQLGLVNSREANVGIRVFNGMDNFEENFDMVFSMKFMKQLTKQINKLNFHAIPKLSSHVEKVDKEWVNVIPSSPNSFELHCSIYSSLNACPPTKVCVLED